MLLPPSSSSPSFPLPLHLFVRGPGLTPSSSTHHTSWEEDRRINDACHRKLCGFVWASGAYKAGGMITHKKGQTQTLLFCPWRTSDPGVQALVGLIWALWGRWKGQEELATPGGTESVTGVTAYWSPGGQCLPLNTPASRASLLGKGE